MRLIADFWRLFGCYAREELREGGGIKSQASASGGRGVRAGIVPIRLVFRL